MPKIKSVCQNFVLLFWLPQGSNKPEILGFNFSRPSTSFYYTIFKMATSRLNMPYNDPAKLRTIIKLVSKPMFLNISNIMVCNKMIMEWLID